MADRVMRMPAGDLRLENRELEHLDSSGEPSPTLHKKCDACEEEDEEAPIQRKAVSEVSANLSSSESGSHVRDTIGSGSRPLDAPTRAFSEPRFGYDLQNVRVHTGSSAEISARSVDARAYTFGSDIVFGGGQYYPESESGRHLLAHELAHVVQNTCPY